MGAAARLSSACKYSVEIGGGAGDSAGFIIIWVVCLYVWGLVVESGLILYSSSRL